MYHICSIGLDWIDWLVLVSPLLLRIIVCCSPDLVLPLLPQRDGRKFMISQMNGNTLTEPECIGLLLGNPIIKGGNVGENPRRGLGNKFARWSFSI